MTDLFTIMGDSFKESLINTFRKPSVWLVLALLGALIYCILTILIPLLPLDLNIALPGYIVLGVVALVLFCISAGAYVKPYRDEEVSFKAFGKTCKQGFQSFIILLIYTIIPLLLAAFITFGFTCWGSLLGTDEDAMFIYICGIVFCWVLVAVLVIIASILWHPAMVNFARTGKFSAAFRMSDLFDMIQKVTWAKVVWAFIVLCLLVATLLGVIYGISYMIMLIPVVGVYLGIIVAALLTPYVLIFVGRFSANLFKEA